LELGQFDNLLLY